MICYDEVTAATFEVEANQIKLRGKKQFHGQDFTRKSQSAYKELLELAKECCKLCAHSFIACTLNNKSWMEEFAGFSKRITSGAFALNEIELTNIQKNALEHLSSPVFAFFRMASNLSEHSAEIELADNQYSRGFNEMSIGVSGTSFDLASLARVAFNAYRTKQFPNAPELIKNGLLVTNSRDSKLIQGADVIGNFSSAYLRKLLGRESKSIDLKAELFESVFGGCGVTPNSLAKFVEICGDDFKLKEDGAFTLKIS